MDKPPLEQRLAEIAEVYWLLAASRPVGFESVSGISAADILAAAAAFGFEPMRFLRVIRACDQVLLQHLRATAERNRAKGKK